MSGHDSRRRSSNISPVVVSLLIQIFAQLEKLPYKPPVTLGLLAINIITHIHPDPYFLSYSLTNIRQNCIRPSLIVTALTNNHTILLNRLVLAGFMHADDMHLYYNMLSLLWKGLQLEQQMGSFQFGVLVVYSLLVSHTLLVVMSYVLFAFTRDMHMSSYDSCAIGFSAVLFSLKYVLNYNSPAYTSIMGLQVPSKWAAWAELVLASLLSPQASFIGHLAGILAGFLYVHMDSFTRSRGGGSFGSGFVGGGRPSSTAAAGGGGVWVGQMDGQEIELEELDEVAGRGGGLSADEIRARRLNRYSNTRPWGTR